MEENQQKKPAWKYTILLIIGLLIAASLAVGVTMLLRNIFTPKPPQAEIAATPATEVIAAVKTNGAIKALENYQEQSTNSASGQIMATQDGKNYAISIPTKLTVLFFAKTPGPQNDTATVEQQISSLMTEKGYSTSENTAQAKKSENPHYTTYKSNVGICQLASAQPTVPSGLAYHTISCTDNSSLSQEYNSIETLLTLYKKEHQPVSFTQATRTVVTEENKALALLNLNGESNTLLLFAAIDNNWEYMGDISSGTNSNGKYSISQDVQSKIDDSRWENFLKKNLK